jgi:PiT family inorganic phosphate transporter
MLLMSVILVVLVFIAVMLVAGNNLSDCVGPAIGSRIVTKRFGMLVGSAGFASGLLIQGSGMIQSVVILLPNASPELRSEAILVAIIVFVVAFKLRVPMSLSMALVGLLAGLSIAEDSPANAMFVSTWFLLGFLFR